MSTQTSAAANNGSTTATAATIVLLSMVIFLRALNLDEPEQASVLVWWHASRLHHHDSHIVLEDARRQPHAIHERSCGLRRGALHREGANTIDSRVVDQPIRGKQQAPTA